MQRSVAENVKSSRIYLVGYRMPLWTMQEDEHSYTHKIFTFVPNNNCYWYICTDWRCFKFYMLNGVLIFRAPNSVFSDTYLLLSNKYLLVTPETQILPSD